MSKIQLQKAKTCPYCSVRLDIDATECFSCKKKVGKLGKHGMAEKPTNYWSYIACLLAWVVFYFYIRWAFF